LDTWKRILLANRAWVAERLRDDTGFFDRLAAPQKPEVLWIGCSDSRVPPDEISGTQPGELFVHRNIANLVVHNDLNLLSVLQYAVEHLEVKHIILCGHYGCGGVNASMTRTEFGLLDMWLRNIKDIYRHHRSEIDLYDTVERRVDRLVEINVLEQVQNLAKTSIIQHAWKQHKRPTLHGWVFSLKDGLMKDLVKVEPGWPLDPVYQYDFPMTGGS
jgi:carbonic anhydrase